VNSPPFWGSTLLPCAVGAGLTVSLPRLEMAASVGCAATFTRPESCQLPTSSRTQNPPSTKWKRPGADPPEAQHLPPVARVKDALLCHNLPILGNGFRQRIFARFAKSRTNAGLAHRTTIPRLSNVCGNPPTTEPPHSIPKTGNSEPSITTA